MVGSSFRWALLLIAMTTGVQSSMAFIDHLLSDKKSRYRRSGNSESPVVQPLLLPELLQEVHFRSSLPMTSNQAWRKAAEKVLSKTTPIRPYPENIEMHRVEETSDPGIRCGSCRVWYKYILYKKPGCASVRIPVRSCRGLCESWEIPHFKPPFYIKHHPVCRPIAVKHYRVKLRGCQNPRDALVRIAMPERCACGPCESGSIDCQVLRE